MIIITKTIKIKSIIIIICIVELRHFRKNKAFLQRFRAFSHFCNIAQNIFAAFRKFYFPQQDLVLRCAIFTSTTSSRLSDEEELKGKANIQTILYFITTKNDCYSEAACLVGKCSFCLDILYVTSLLTTQLNLYKRVSKY